MWIYRLAREEANSSKPELEAAGRGRCRNQGIIQE